MHKHLKKLLTLVMGVYLTQALPLGAQEPALLSDLMEEAIYLQEVSGDVEKAVVLYQQIVTTANVTRELAARAQYQLGLSYQQLNQPDAAEQAFREVLSKYGDVDPYNKLVANILNPSFSPASIPWENGERLQYSMEVAANGQAIGTLVVELSEEQWQGRDVWKIANRNFGRVHNFSQIIVDRTTLKPLFTKAFAQQFGGQRIEGTWYADKVEIKNLTKGENKTVAISGAVYDDESIFTLLRTVPFELSYKAKVSFTSIYLGNEPAPGELEVVAEEVIEVPAGTFDAYKLTYAGVIEMWFSKQAPHYPLKISNPLATTILLTDIGKIGEGVAERINASQTDFSFLLPSGWNVDRRDEEGQLSIPARMSPDGNVKTITWPYEVIGAFEPEGKVRVNINVANVENLTNVSFVDLTLEGRTQQRMNTIKNGADEFAVREGSEQDTTLYGLPAKTYIADIKDNGQELVLRTTVVKNGNFVVRVEAFFDTGYFEEASTYYDDLIASMEWL